MQRARSLSEAFGSKGRIGAAGEAYFGRGLRNAGLDRFQLFGSLNLPTPPGQMAMRSDVDWAIANGNSVVLIDVKRWAGPQPYWTIPALGLPMKGFRPLVESGRWRLSQNMLAALDRYRKAMPGADVSAMVVFVPTSPRSQGDSMPSNVDFLIWPGEIRSYRAEWSFSELFRRLDGDPEWTPGAAGEAAPDVREVPSSILRVLQANLRH